jgi:hypothetical protein
MSTVPERSGGAIEPRPILPNVYPMVHPPAVAGAEEFPVERVAAAFRGFLESLGLDLEDPISSARSIASRAPIGRCSAVSGAPSRDSALSRTRRGTPGWSP